MPETQENEKTRLPRHVYRKHIKLIKRKQQRQKEAQRQHTVLHGQPPLSPDPLDKEQEQKIYLEQKAQWEEKERQYNLIAMARKKVIETERKARELAMEKWHASLRTLSLPKPPGYSSSSSEHASTSRRSSSSVQKKFIPSSSSASTLPERRRRTYRDRFELSKKA